MKVRASFIVLFVLGVYLVFAHQVFVQKSIISKSVQHSTPALATAFTYPLIRSAIQYIAPYDAHPPVNVTNACYAVNGNQLWNAGEDWFAPVNSAVKAVANGQVLYVGGNFPGLAVIIEHTLPDGISHVYSVYTHLSPQNILVKVGDSVAEGQTIDTGLVSQSYAGKTYVFLHWEMRFFADASAICPGSGMPGPGYTYPGHPDDFVSHGNVYNWTNPSQYIATHASYISQAGSWNPAGRLSVARFSPRLTRLENGTENGMVLLEGGNAQSTYTADSELYNPATNTWAETGSLNVGRTEQTATLLQNGDVLVSGGYNGPVLNSAEIFDPRTNIWTLTGSMTYVRTRHTATLLPDGDVLVAGGWDGDMINTAEIYHPPTGTWSLAAPMDITRADHVAVLLPNGLVLVAGGAPENNTVTGESELYNPATNTWSVTGSMQVPRAYAAAVLLPDGEVLVAGGTDASGNATNTAELYDPTTGQWTLTGNMQEARNGLRDQNMQLLQDGTVLIAGGDSTGTSEIYDPASGTWGSLNTMLQPQCGAGTALLNDGRVLVAAGYDCVNFNNKSSATEFFSQWTLQPLPPQEKQS